MTPLTRRNTLRLGGSALAALAVPGCTGRPGTYPPHEGDSLGPLIDVHCHLFNGTDLPITTFLTRLFLPAYDPPACQLGPKSAPKSGLRTARSIDDPDIGESLIEFIANVLLSGTLTARQELDRIKGGRTRSAASERARVATQTRDRLANFLAQPPASASSARRAKREEALRQALWQEADAATGAKLLRGSDQARKAADALLTSRGKYGLILTWVQLFFRPRQDLAQELATASLSSGRAPLMLVPLTVDYTHWLGETPNRDSSLADQVAVYAEIASRATFPLHAMVAYDPLRAVFWKLGRHNRFKDIPEFDPLDLARRALTQQGCIGLKLYPPMGFRATGNSNTDADYPGLVLKALKPKKGTLGTELDDAMARAFDLCTELDAPILAHASNSLSAGRGYGDRAEPRYWIDALKTRPRLRLCLAHAGGFCWQETDPPAGTPADRQSWEWTIGRYVRDNPDSHLYMDISYFSETFGSPAELKYITGQLRDWIKDCDPDVRHILYGTDWTMLGQEPGWPTYGKTVQAFLKNSLMLTDRQIERVMWQNAMRYLGLDRGASRDRLLAFYGSRRPEWTLINLPPEA